MTSTFEGLGQVANIFDLWPSSAEWFLVGGPGDSDEAQTVIKRFPHMNCAGFEPNPNYVIHQRKARFPGSLMCCALWDRDREPLSLDTPVGATPRSASVCRPKDATDADGASVSSSMACLGRTLDSLSEEMGPFQQCVLWLDIEYAEPAALRGAKKLLDNGEILLINLEVFEKSLPSMITFLGRWGMRLVRKWNERTPLDAIDAVFVKEQH